MYKKGFESQNNEIEISDLPIIGKIPNWLNGTLFRNGPGKFEYPNKKLVHWFDGPAMISRFEFNNGKMSYQNKFVETEIYSGSNKQGKMIATEYGTDHRNSLRKIVDLVRFKTPKMSDNVNVNFLKVRDDLLAITGGKAHYQFNQKNLETINKYKFEDDRKINLTGQTPHPSLDTKTGDTYNIGFNFMKNEYQFIKIPKGTKKRINIATVKTKRMSDIHSFSTTENYIIFIEIPWLLNKLKLITQSSYLDALEWKPENGTHFIVVNKQTGNVKTIHYDEALNFGHTANAFEKDNKIIIDMPYFSSSNINDMRVDNILEVGQSIDEFNSFSRFTIDLNKEIVMKEKIVDDFVELETINYKNYNEKEYQFTYGPSQLKTSKFFDRLIKIDVKNKSIKYWLEENTFPGEPIFVAHPEAKSEDDGILLTVFLDGESGNSFMHIMDAKSFTEIARINLPQHIPFGFHGQFYKNY